MEETKINIFQSNAKLDEAYEILCEKLNAIADQFQLDYFEFFGLLECFRCDLIKQNLTEDEI